MNNIMNNMFHIVGQFKLLYRISLGGWFKIMTAFLAVWTGLMIFLYGKAPVEEKLDPARLQRSIRRSKMAFALNLLLMLGGLTVIMLITFVRRETSERYVILIPLRVLFGLRAPGDYWHVTVMNIVLYVPFACGLCFVMGKRFTHPTGVTVLICFTLSIAAEALQYILVSGWVEADDVLMNTLGAALGTLPYVITSRVHQKFSVNPM